MQTFLPLPDLVESARCLDTNRLRKQRIEVLQILKTLNAPAEENPGWSKLPAVLMWDGYVEALVDYGVHCCEAYAVRGFPDNGMANNILDHSWGNESKLPDWFGGPIHSTHRTALLRKGLDDATWEWSENNKLAVLTKNPLAPRKKSDWSPRFFEHIRDEHQPVLDNWYAQFGWNEEPAIPDSKGSYNYYWPVKEKSDV